MSGMTRTTLRRFLRIAMGAVLAVAGAAGLSRAVPAARAERIYLQTKYGLFAGTSLETPAPQDAASISDAATRASGLYESNYYFPALASRAELDEASSAWIRHDWSGWSNHVDRALFFGGEALRLNPYDAEARDAAVHAMLRAGSRWRGVDRIAEAESLVRGLLEREFWNPSNHDLWADVCLRRGDLRAAGAEYRFVNATYPQRDRLRRQAQRYKLPLNLPHP